MYIFAQVAGLSRPEGGTSVAGGIRCALALAVLSIACGQVPEGPSSDGEPDTGAPIETRPTPPPWRRAVGPKPAQVFQPAFHQALRWTWWTNGRITFRFKVPIARGGERVRITFLAGDGPATVYRATIAQAGNRGTLGSAPVLLTFGGERERLIAAHERATSDPVRFPVSRGDELYISFEGEGGFAASAIDAFPDSFRAPDSQSRRTALYDPLPHEKLTGLQSIDVEAEREIVFVAIGDSITEGYVNGHDDIRNAWPSGAGALSGHPVVNGAVSGQGLWGALENLDRDVLALDGVTDCAVLLGTNDLAADSTEKMVDRLETLFARLRPQCRVWAGTLLPKERATDGDLAVINGRRRALNEWLRRDANVTGVIDFDLALRDAAHPDHFVTGYGEDGIHPTVSGQRVMSEVAADVISSAPPPPR